MKRTMKKLLLLLLALTISTSCLASCAVAPTTEFNSLAELQEAIKDSPDMILPDISAYKFEEDSRFWVDYRTSRKKTPAMYSISGLTENDDSVLAGLYLECRILNFYVQRGMVFEDLDLNAEYFGKQMHEKLVDQTKDPDFMQYNTLEKGTLFYSISYYFDLKECQYGIGGDLIIPADEASLINIDDEIEKSKQELLQIVKPIIEKDETVFAADDFEMTEEQTADDFEVTEEQQTADELEIAEEQLTADGLEMAEGQLTADGLEITAEQLNAVREHMALCDVDGDAEFAILYNHDNIPKFIMGYSENGYLIMDKDTFAFLESGSGNNPYYEHMDEKKYFGGVICYFISYGDKYINLTTGSIRDKVAYIENVDELGIPKSQSHVADSPE